MASIRSKLGISDKEYKDSFDWFRSVLKKQLRYGDKKADDFMNKKRNRRIKSGEMIAFKYPNPITPLKQLKWFDASPVDIILEIKGKHMLCMNLHYVPVPMRKIILKKVIMINKSKVSKQRRFELRYRMIREFLAKHGILDLVIKKYIIGRMKSVVHVPYEEWKYAVELKSEKFVFDGRYSMNDIHAMIRRGSKSTRASKNKHVQRR